VKLPANRLRMIALVILAAAVGWVLMHHQQWNEGRIAADVQRFGLWAPAAFVALYVVATVLLVPGAILTLTGGGIFGPLWGTVWNLVAATMSASVAFLISRYIAAEWVRARAGPRLSRIIEGAEAEGWRFVAFTRLVPIFPFNPLNYALGLTRIRFATYALTSAVCMLPGSIAYSYLGYAGRAAASGNLDAIRYGIIGFGLIGALAVLPPLLRRWRAQPDGDTVDDPARAQVELDRSHPPT